MSEPNKVEITDCTKNPNTCPVFAIMHNRETFESLVECIDDTAKSRRETYGEFVVACVNGTCPGQDPELTMQIIRYNKLNKETPD